MNIKHFALTTGIAISGIIANGSATPAGAFTFVLGEDIGANSASAIPNSNAAETSFFSNLTGSQTESFESFTPGASATTVLNGIVGATITTNSATSGISNTPFSGRFPITGTQYYEVGSANGITTTITFANPIAAVGFYTTDIENAEGITLQLSGNANTQLTVPTTANSINGSALYYGLIAQNPNETFNSITFSLGLVAPNKQNDRFGIDNLTVATLSQLKSSSTAVPEPLTIIGTLVGGIAALRMRNQLKSIAKD